MIHLKNIEVYSPKFIGKKDILISSKTIEKITDTGKNYSDAEAEVIDCEGLIAMPGLIDAHVHIAGAGGEGGPATRTGEIKLNQLIVAGVTSVVGCLGTDGFTRTPESVLMKVKALRAEGMSAWMYTGAYQTPTNTILGDVGKDIALIEEIIGAGEIAISDHRSSCPTCAELTRLASHARVGGMLGGKAGIVNVHMGDAQNPFQPIHDVVKNSELKYKTFLPTHCNRNYYIFEDAIEYGKNGYVDITTSSYPYFPEYEIKPSQAIIRLIKGGVPPSHITMTSDSCGSLPLFDEKGNLVRIETGQPISLFNEMVDAIKEGCIPEFAIATVTSNVADILKLKGKGRIAEKNDADMVLCTKDFDIKYVLCGGKWFMFDKEIIKKGAYE